MKEESKRSKEKRRDPFKVGPTKQPLQVRELTEGFNVR